MGPKIPTVHPKPEPEPERLPERPDPPKRRGFSETYCTTVSSSYARVGWVRLPQATTM